MHLCECEGLELDFLSFYGGFFYVYICFARVLMKCSESNCGALIVVNVLFWR